MIVRLRKCTETPRQWKFVCGHQRGRKCNLWTCWRFEAVVRDGLMNKPGCGAINVAFSVLLALSCTCGAVRADQFYDAGLKSFQAKKYPDAARYFEQAIKNAPW